MIEAQAAPAGSSPRPSVVALCRAARLTAQAYYKGRREHQLSAVAREVIGELVRRERAAQPRLGAKKLFVLLKEELASLGIRLGRDRFLDILRASGLLLKPLPRKAARTTDSRHGFFKHQNLLRHVEVSMTHQVWVADLTYVRTAEGFLYLSLISDAHSRKIVGHHAGDTLEAFGCLAALKQALGQLPAGARPIHHSDRGVQYCCTAYVEQLSDRGLPISMTEENHCYENAQAERLNGILKGEYALEQTFPTKALARRAIEQAIALYNTRRPHMALGYRIPHVVHEEAA